MNDPQVEKVAGLIAGVQLAVVHLSNVLAARGIASREVLAASFRETAEKIPTGARNRDAMTTVLDQIAKGLGTSGETPEEPTRVFLRLLKGGKTDSPDPKGGKPDPPEPR